LYFGGKARRLRKGVRNQEPNGPKGAPHYWFLTPFLNEHTVAQTSHSDNTFSRLQSEVMSQGVEKNGFCDVYGDFSTEFPQERERLRIE